MSLNMTCQCVDNKVIKTPTNKNFVIVMPMNKQFLADYLLKFPFNDEGRHLTCSSLKVIMDKFNTLVYLNYRNFIYVSKQFVHSEVGTMNIIMELKDHYGLKYVYGNIFSRQSKDNVFIFKMLMDLWRSGVNLVKCMHVREDMEN